MRRKAAVLAFLMIALLSVFLVRDIRGAAALPNRAVKPPDSSVGTQSEARRRSRHLFF